MKRGPKSQTPEQAARRGNAGKRKAQKERDAAAVAAVDTPVDAAPSAAAPPIDTPAPAAPAAPALADVVELTPAARRVWDALMPLLATMSFVKSTDHGVIARYCTHLARWIELNGKVNTRGDVHYETQSLHGKMLRQHPDFAALMRIEAALVTIEDRVGLTPAARQALVIKAASAPSDPNRPGINPTPAAPSAIDDPDPTSLFAKLHAAQPEGRAN